MALYTCENHSNLTEPIWSDATFQSFYWSSIFDSKSSFKMKLAYTGLSTGKPRISAGVWFVCMQSFVVLQRVAAVRGGAALATIKDVANDSISTCDVRPAHDFRHDPFPFRSVGPAAGTDGSTLRKRRNQRLPSRGRVVNCSGWFSKIFNGLRRLLCNSCSCCSAYETSI